MYLLSVYISQVQTGGAFLTISSCINFRVKFTFKRCWLHICSVSCSVAQAYVNQKKLDTETKILQANVNHFAKQTTQWLKLVEDFNQSLKVSVFFFSIDILKCCTPNLWNCDILIHEPLLTRSSAEPRLLLEMQFLQVMCAHVLETVWHTRLWMTPINSILSWNAEILFFF